MNTTQLRIVLLIERQIKSLRDLIHTAELRNLEVKLLIPADPQHSPHVIDCQIKEKTHETS
ncbi:hypothetical protein LCGC14_0389830 [marine sediment metagenome]|uniref:Uncharacterized protein n=1 Tax=marine sediment metagenome TaxID=412755 RepID=A0A0F9VM48_9ZZZZ